MGLGIDFMTPPDGSQPRMRMYVWDTATVSTARISWSLTGAEPPGPRSPSVTEISRPGSSFTNTAMDCRPD